MFTHVSVKDELWAAFVQTTEFHEKIMKIDPSKALVCFEMTFIYISMKLFSLYSFQKIPGVHSFYSAKDIPGKNSFTRNGIPGLLEDEVIFVEIDATIQYNGEHL